MLLSPMGNVSGKPKPKHLLIETDDKGIKNDDYQTSFSRNCFGDDTPLTPSNPRCDCFPTQEICRRRRLGFGF